MSKMAVLRTDGSSDIVADIDIVVESRQRDYKYDFLDLKRRCILEKLVDVKQPASESQFGWGFGVSFLIGGILMTNAGRKRSFSFTIAAFVLAIINVLLSVINISFIFDTMTHSVIWPWGPWRCRDQPNHPYHHIHETTLNDCTDDEFRIAIFMMASLTLAAFAEMISVVWAIVITSQAFCHGGCVGGAERDSSPEVHRNIYVNTKCLRSNWICHLVSTLVSIVTTVVIIFIYAYSISIHRILFLQNIAPALWSAPVYLLTAYCGFRAWKFGENSSLISFLVLNVIQLPLCGWEWLFSVWAIYLKFEHYMTPIHPNYDTSEKVVTVLHGIVTFSALLHIIISIRGIIAASIAVNKDGACYCCCSRPNCAERGCCECCIDDDDDGTLVFHTNIADSYRSLE